ncbi:MAG: hypothetical protein ACI9VR_000041 [Cognaticolwellia sp.]|jgi:hypothetical protein
MLLILLAFACTNSNDGSSSTDTVSAAVVGVNPDNFADGALATDITTVDCTLSNGTETQCYSITITGDPANHDIGPFCPRNISEGAETAGKWIESGTLYDLDGDFIVALAEFYGDDDWQLYNESSGAVNVTETQEACEGAAKPDVEEQYQNHCVECALEYITDTTYTPSIRQTDRMRGLRSHASAAFFALEMLAHSFVLTPCGVALRWRLPRIILPDRGCTLEIPVTPTLASSANEIDTRGKIGVALSGVVFDPPAPTDAILAAHTIAAFDDCGGHVNPNTGYYYYAATGCSTEVEQADHAPLIGYAMDGFGLYGNAA